MSEYLDAIYDNSKIIRECGDELLHLARCFKRIGNKEMYDNLIAIASDVDTAQEKINHAVSLNINNELNESKKRVGEALSLTLNNIIKQSDKNHD